MIDDDQFHYHGTCGGKWIHKAMLGIRMSNEIRDIYDLAFIIWISSYLVYIALGQ